MSQFIILKFRHHIYIYIYIATVSPKSHASTHNEMCGTYINMYLDVIPPSFQELVCMSITVFPVNKDAPMLPISSSYKTWLL